MPSPRFSHPGLVAYTQPDRPLAGRYAIERDIGSGGMAFVVLATDLKHKRQVAVKILRRELASTVDTTRFLREIRIGAGLTHPHIVPIHDSGAENDLLYYVMPYVEGETLAARVARDGALPVTEALRLAQQIGSALEYAHQQGVVHRDVKPENVMLPGGVAVVSDFGLARATELDSGSMRITDTGMGLGTPTYISPEQALGASDVDGRADQYSLAVMVYEMLTGRPPFVARTTQHMLAQHISTPASSLIAIRADIPRGVHDAVLRALSKSPRDRFHSVQAFINALEHAASHPDSALQRLRDLFRRG